MRSRCARCADRVFGCGWPARGSRPATVNCSAFPFSAPTLLVWGRSDRLIPPVYAERFQALIPQAELALIDAAGHMLPYEQPEAFVSAVTRFL